MKTNAASSFIQQPVFLFALILIITLCVLPAQVRAEFTQGHLIVVNDPSAMSAGIDFLVELDTRGDLFETLVPQSMGITGMRRVVFDPVSGHLFYSISSWPSQVFEIREIDSSGNLVATFAHPDFDSGNISMAVHANGDLYIANGGYIYVKYSGQSDIVRLFTLPYTGIGDLEIDHWGNLFLSDPFISDVVYKIFPNGQVEVYAGPADGLDGPYGLAVDDSGTLYIANNTGSDPCILKMGADGEAVRFTDDQVRMGILDMTVDNTGILYTANRENDTIYSYDANGSAALFADEKTGLFVPSSMAFIKPLNTCQPDADSDGDVDGQDLAGFALNFSTDCIEQMSLSLGSDTEV